MKYIAKFSPIPADPTNAEERTRNEFYRRPCNYINGKSLGEFHLTSNGPMKYVYGEGEEVIQDEWLKAVVSDLFVRFIEVGGAVTRFFAGSGGQYPRPAEFRLEAGYTAYITKSKNPVVLAETYVACSGNAVVVIHRGDTDVLYVNSARHGIPGLAMNYRDMEPLEVVLYDSLRTDAKWYECGLEHPDVRDERTIPGWKYEVLGEEIEARIA